MENSIQSDFDYSVLLTVLVPILFYLIILILAVFLIMNTIRFFKRRALIDTEILKNLEEIKAQTQKSDKKS